MYRWTDIYILNETNLPLLEATKNSVNFLLIPEYFNHNKDTTSALVNKHHLFRPSSHLPRRVLSSAATGSREYFSGMAFPSGRPRWLISTTDLAPWSRQCWMLGTAALILKAPHKWTGVFRKKRIKSHLLKLNINVLAFRNVTFFPFLLKDYSYVCQKSRPVRSWHRCMEF